MRALPAALLLLAAGLSGCLGPAPGPSAGEAADLIVHGAVVWTNDARGTLAQALAVRDGRIARVGSDAEVLALRGPATKVVDLDGGFVSPGWRDQHAHVLGRAASYDGTGPNPFEPSLGQQSMADTESGRAQVAGDHVATKAAGKTPMDAWEQDPVTDCPPPRAVTPELKARLRFGLEQAAKQGLTSFVEPGLRDLGLWDALQEMEREGPLPVRVLMRISWGCIDEAAARGLRTGVGSEWVKVLGVKMYSDGWLGPRTCALREPYADRPLYDGILFRDPAFWVGAVRKARELGFSIGTHAIGDRAMEVMFEAYEANGVTPQDRWALEHAQVLAPDLLERFAATGVVLSMQLSFATSDMGFAEAALGPERARWAYAWKSALDAGVPMAGGSDFAIDVLNPLWGLQRVVTRSELTGQPEGGWHPEERLSLEQALKLITSGAAYASLEEDERGSLEAGKRADLVALRENLLVLPEDAIASATVVLTVVNGVVSFEGAQSYPPRALEASAAAAEAFTTSAPTKGRTPSSTAVLKGT